MLISFPYPMCARNILRSEAWAVLRDGAKLTVVSHLATDAEFRSEAGGDDVTFQDYASFPVVVRGALRTVIDAETFKWTRERDLVTLQIIEQTIRKGMADPILARFDAIFCRRSEILARFDGVRKALLAFVRRAAIRQARYARMLDEVRPDIALLTHPYTWEERLLTPVLKHRGVPTIAAIHSWDNPTTHPVLLERYDHVLVWNDILKAQMMRLYDYPADCISATGMPQLDSYAHGELNVDRAEFLSTVGLAPDRRLITYACGAPEFVPGQERIVAHLAKIVTEGVLREPASLLVRLHPGRDAGDIGKLAGVRHVHIDQPSVAYSANYARQGWHRDRADERHFINLLRHSDVFINAFSTTTIEAAAVDVPIVNIAFDGDGSRPYHASLRKHYDWEHYSHIVKSGGVRLTRSYDDLTAAIQESLQDPGLRREGRRRIVREQCGPLDGHAGRRLALAVLERIDGRAAAQTTTSKELI